ncbi:hypothetical protein ACLB2K_004109 [Fragaria x ananassa]
MSSIGASYAGVYVMQQKQKEKMERMKKEKERKRESSSNVDDREIKVTTAQSGRNKKVHPGNFPSPASATSPVDGAISERLCVMYKSFRLCNNYSCL